MAKKQKNSEMPLLSVMLALSNIAEARDELIMGCLGYKPSKRSDLENKIARLAVVLGRDTPAVNKQEVQAEFNTLVKRYDEEFNWTNH